jgi:dTDP-4-amino-4,6-dideoxygalactose transaminase
LKSIPFNIPPYLGSELDYIKLVVETEKKICGDGLFTKKCHLWFEQKMLCQKSLLTTSCTHALEMAAILCNINIGDEVIAPSYTFVSTVNAFVLRGATIKFIDIRPETMNINEDLIEEAITNKTKVIIPVHYAGVSCNMTKILSLASHYNLKVVEDAAQGVMATYKGKYLGTIGDFGTYSFHETKNYSCGEGGALIINNSEFIERAEIIREKGTDRSKFYRGQVDKYSWKDIGSSYLPSEINAAYLYTQLEQAELINNNRLKSWNLYFAFLKNLEDKGAIELPHIPKDCEHNAHMFYIKLKNIKQRQHLIDFLKIHDILSVFHYIPLHSSEAGKRYGSFIGKDIYTTKESEKILRLPMYYDLSEKDIERISSLIHDFFKKNKLI